MNGVEKMECISCDYGVPIPREWLDKDGNFKESSKLVRCPRCSNLFGIKFVRIYERYENNDGLMPIFFEVNEPLLRIIVK